MANSRKAKRDYLGGRVDEDLREQVDVYLDDKREADDPDMSMGKLIRESVKEYMAAHPVPIKE